MTQTRAEKGEDAEMIVDADDPRLIGLHQPSARKAAVRTDRISTHCKKRKEGVHAIAGSIVAMVVLYQLRHSW
jgi:hypothetical protein